METTNTKRRRWLIGGIVAAVAAALYFGEKKVKKGRHKGLKGTDDEMFELSSVDGERGCVTPLYDDADLYGDDYDRAKKWLRKELKADGLKIDKFWINEADECWEFIAKKKSTNNN